MRPGTVGGGTGVRRNRSVGSGTPAPGGGLGAALDVARMRVPSARTAAERASEYGNCPTHCAGTSRRGAGTRPVIGDAFGCTGAPAAPWRCPAAPCGAMVVARLAAIGAGFGAGGGGAVRQAVLPSTCTSSAAVGGADRGRFFGVGVAGRRTTAGLDGAAVSSGSAS